jgi:hypothetical protein
MIGDAGSLPEAARWRYTARMDMRPPQGPGRLPPPPAPTARDANPWKFSATARKEEARPATGYERLFEELKQAQVEREGVGAPAEQPAPADEAGTEPDGRRESTFNRVFPIVILLIMFGSFAREVIESGGGDEARLALVVAALLLVAAVAAFLALRRVRRRARRR